MTAFPYITTLTFLPLIGGLIVIGLGSNRKKLRNWRAGFRSVSASPRSL
jgi:hypothetical protein